MGKPTLRSFSEGGYHILKPKRLLVSEEKTQNAKVKSQNIRAKLAGLTGQRKTKKFLALSCSFALCTLRFEFQLLETVGFSK